MATKEYREFFLRHGLVNSGAHPDQEVGYPDQYMVGSELKFNRWLAHDFPSQGINEKLFESLTFKLNKEDTASDAAQGLVRLATYIESIGGRDAIAGQFSNVVRPSHLPVIDTVLRSTDTAISISGKRNNGQVNLLEVSDANAAKLNIGDHLVGTGIASGAIVLDIIDTGANINTVVMSVAATSGTNTVTTVTVEDTINGIKLTKAIRTNGTFSRVVWIIETNAATLPYNVEGLEKSNVNAIVVSNTTTVDFDFGDDIPTGNYIATVSFAHASSAANTTSTARLAKDGVGVGTTFAFGGNDTLSELSSFSVKIAITLGEMLQLKIHAGTAGAGDVSLGSPRIVTLIKVN